MAKIIILKSRISKQGGLERYAMMIAKAFAQKGHDVTLLTTDQIIEIQRVKTVSLASHPKSSLFAIYMFEKWVTRWLKRNSYDLVFGFDRNSFQTHYRAGNGSHQTFLKIKEVQLSKRILNFFSLKQRLILKIEKKLFCNPLTKTYFTNSEMVKKEIKSQFDIPDKQIAVVHNGVDLKKFNFSEADVATARQKLNLKNAEHWLLFMGNNYQRKGLKETLSALAGIKDWNFGLLVVGKDKNISFYEKLAQSLKLKDKVHFFGSQENTLDFYKAADALILPSHYDPFANVTVEALAMGQFVITSSSNGGSEVIKPECGIIIKNLQDQNELEKAFLKLREISLNYSARLKRRSSIIHLDINNQLHKIVDITLSSAQL